ncbi:TIM-barrel domain-containing protein [Populibacterium corticicola]|uniref:TIM-barrel domain-containing protein n=1 Tax=Populibacterium corticicola TaxID=1812826 RepID=A0ABW5XF39_9MICO
MSLTVTHRPYGIEHPYATSADQRVPVHPAIQQDFSIGAVVTSDGDPQVELHYTPDGQETQIIPLAPYSPSAADAAALAGGDGHLASAQAAQLESDGAWSVTIPGLRAGQSARYRIVATQGSESAETAEFVVSPTQWVADAEEPRGKLTINGGHAHDRLVPGSVEWQSNADGLLKVRFALRLEDAEHVVGFGERYDHVDQRGHTLDAVVFEQYKSQGEHHRTYMPMPFAHVIGGTGWGFHVETLRRSWYDVGASTATKLFVEVALGGSQSEELNVRIMDGSAQTVLSAFLDTAGRPEQMPEWIFELWASGNEWNTQQIVMDRMDAHRDLDIPVGVIVIEAWSDEEGITIWRDAEYSVNSDGSAHAFEDFTFNREGAWPDPKAMIDELHSRGIKVILWQIPLQKTSHDLGDSVPQDSQVLTDGRAMVEAGLAVREADGTPYHNRGWWFPQALMADLSTQEGRDWWTEKRRYLVEGFDIDGFKTDGGEHAWGWDLQYGDGRRGDEGNNLYPVHYARAFGDLLRSAGKAPVTFSRSGFTGSQAHGLFWAGDENSTWQAFRNSVVAGITAGSCGILYWGWDLAGFSGPVPDSELYIRATGASVFMPIMQYHSEFNHHQRPLRDRTPWYVASSNETPEVVEQFRYLAKLREALVPYIKEQADASVETDVPLLRGLFFDYPLDVRIWEHDTQYLFGDAFLVNPVLEAGAGTQPVATYLPEGTWVDVFTGDEHEGGQVVSRTYTLLEVPVFAKVAQWPTLRGVFGL